MIIAQMSDLHLRTDGKPLSGGVDSVAALEAGIRHLNALPRRPDVVLITGDLANNAHPLDYQTLRRLLDGLHMPAYVIPGNHDNREMLRDVFGDLGYMPENGPFLHYTVEDYALRLIGLDTVVEGSEGGEMCADRRRWLDQRLSEEADRPTLIFMHHHPFRTGISFMDKTGFVGARELEAVVARHDQVIRVICGHSHRSVHVNWAGTIASVAPSIAFQIVMDLNGEATPGFILEPPACPVFMWDADTGGLVGHLSVIGDFGPRHPFDVKPR